MVLYSLNVVMTPERDKVLMVSKNRPSFMKGFLNFPGGKVEEFDKSLKDCAKRETFEECGVDTNPILIGIINGGEDFRIEVFRSIINRKEFDKAHSKTDECVVAIDIEDWYNHSRDMYNLVYEILCLASYENPPKFCLN